MKKVLCYSTLAMSILASAHAQAFDSFYTFGDSLSDGGFIGSQSRFIAGSDSKLYNEILAEHYASDNHAPYTFGGNNYAEAGATADNYASGLLRTDLQISYYLSQNGGVADKNGLYMLWIGANDISYDVEQSIAKLNFGGLFSTGNDYLLSSAPDAVVTQTQMLLDAGAGYVIVPTLPRAGLTPWTATALFSFAQTILGQNVLDLPRLYKQLDTALRSKGPVDSEAQCQQFVIDSLEQVLAENGVLLPRQATEKVYEMILNMENTLTDQFNYSTEQGLAQLNGNIVRADVGKLFDEIITSSKEYGFDNVLAPVCQIGVGAPQCKETSASFHDDQVYMFSDWFHPSPEAHAVIAQYIMSVIDAPYYATTLSKALESANDEHRAFLEGQLQSLRTNPTEEKVSVFGGYSGKYRHAKSSNSDLDGRDTSNSGNIGFSIQAAPWLAVGGMMSAGAGDFKVSDHYKYDYNGKVMSLFMQATADNGLWGNLDTSFGDMDLNGISRKIQLGKAVRTEKGSTQASSFGVALNLGYDFSVTDYLTTGPVIGYSYDKYKVDGYRERGNNSTSMHFGDQRHELNTVSAGWRIDTRTLPVNPYFEVSYHRNFNDDPISVAGAVNSTATSFTRQGAEIQKEWVNAKLGASAKLTDKLGLFGVVNYNGGNNSSDEVNYSVGVNYIF